MSTPPPAYLSLEESYRQLREAAGLVELARDFILVSGPEAEGYLQGQLSQEVEALGPGDSALSLLLEPQGKITAFLRVSRLSEDAFLLDLDAGFGEAARARLARFKLRTRAEIEVLVGWRCLARRGPAATSDPSGPAGPRSAGLDGVVSRFPWPGLDGYDLLGRAPSLPRDLPWCRPEAYEARRIETGLPRLGAELDEGTIPAAAGLVEACVSFTKGCYTGQELVARIDSRGGNVPWRLRGLVSTGPDSPSGSWAAGATLWVDGAPAGRITSAADSPRLGRIGLGYVHRRFTPPLEALAGTEGAGPGAGGGLRVEALPLDADAGRAAE